MIDDDSNDNEKVKTLWVSDGSDEKCVSREGVVVRDGWVVKWGGNEYWKGYIELIVFKITNNLF